MVQSLGAVIYLRTAKILRLADFAAQFHQLWPGTPLVEEGKQGNAAYFSMGETHLAVEVKSTTVPQAVTDAVLDSTRHWPDARKELGPHVAHVTVGSSGGGSNGLDIASHITKAIVALVRVTDSIGVCWLNGPVVHASRQFSAIAVEMFHLGRLPLMLWIAACWKPEERVIHTTGMVQFDAPEILIAKQPIRSTELIAYLFDAANYILRSGNMVVDGETMEGPNGVLKIESVTGKDSKKRALILVPVQPN